MKISTAWLLEWVEPCKEPQLDESELDVARLAEQLTMAGLEVDALSPVAGKISKVIVAEVLSTTVHPNADKLTLCQININQEEPLQVVCGASNVRAGLKVALAMIGAVLPGDFKIKESKLRGELSQGMLCSVAELGMADQSEGILELDANAPVGMDLAEYLMLDDHIIDVNITPNRADCFSALGLARETAALNQLELVHYEVPEVSETIQDILNVQLQAPSACPRYCGRILRNINSQATTPLWMSERLRRSGLRTVHPVVDVLNYVMLELGQPMHAFDLGALEGGIQVRLSQENESLLLLDGQELPLTGQELVIADEKKPLALAGVMGGANSAVLPHTTDVFLESAFFNPIMIAGVARKFALFSDSSQRYERGVDPLLQRRALQRATALLQEIVGGDAGPVIESIEPSFLPQEVKFSFDLKKVEKICGILIPDAVMKALLQSIGVLILSENGSVLEVHIPSYRFDLRQEVDLVEEIIRLYGYENLQPQPIKGLMIGGSTEKQTLASRVSTWLSTKGYCETISYSFVDPELQEALFPEQQVMQLLNPISSELSQMRVSLWPGLIASLIHNVHRQQQVLRLFETGVIFAMQEGQLQEKQLIAGLLMGEQGALSWNESARHYDFFDLKGDLESLFASLKLENATFKAMPHPALHPGQSAQIELNNSSIGWVGTLHPRLADALDLQQEVILFELNIDALKTHMPLRYQGISKYPQIRRDLSFLVDEGVLFSEIEKCIRTVIKDDWLKSLEIFDVYRGKGVPEGKKSLALALILQDATRTLVDDEINSLISAIINVLENEFSITLRE